MSDIGPELPEDEALAAEHALGVLNAADRARAEARMARDAGFAAEVEAWRARLSPLLDAIPAVAPPPALWPRIERRLPANDNAGGIWGSVRFLRGATLGSLGLAAASLIAVLMIANRPTPVAPVPPPAALLNAKLDTNGGQHLFVAAYDPGRKALLVTSLVAPGGDPRHVHELWLIPADGKPRSLGLVAPGTTREVPMAPEMASLATEGASLAVSVEPPGGSAQDGPSGPVAAAGKLARV